MDIRKFIVAMEEVAPPDLAEEYDAGRIGLIVEGRGELETICCALDATQRVVEAAAAVGADMLVVHHTPLWNPITAVRGATSHLLRSLLSSGMNLYVMHTNFDHAEGGVNDTLASRLGLQRIERMTAGLVGDCTLDAEEIARRLPGGGIRVYGRVGTIRRLAVMGGSGFDPNLIQEAADLGADAFLSAELKHSVARASPIPCLEAIHYALEAPAMEALASRMGWHYIPDPPHVVVVP
ncbi:MAG TPA: Nif3-like dinuclear metal center hexameric protein [Candidatus Methanoculleus thermohydrogenotrophicum]|jgi:dinuclear metal center YbgI/SA1388 family protein|nr:Nif3-like dinuclear metal center hexameric protein [Candidatus Methanoculleus thermohydrogenotrophicum]NLM81655.1 Nif3-like dinuclear metal center hexameric protein [Candidatus Methanoculleus thermohydrogenotrophicum]HOB18508.1 Nif3-like dinuclear metal center hexameric protein [Candidatus Methanoculleus thermohydrogenotrophicum]HPZ38574.1 Nif3-like dinuclear metal center hexameric protein [Candidatus Methanoculleus thermohydrogenotrophicum]HQC91802.1 Nif3-like dinuclear metal center hexamer